MKKRIGIDARLAGQTGVGTYIKNLLHFLPVNTKEHDIEYVVYLYDQDLPSLPRENKHITYKKAPYRWHSLSEQVDFYKMLHNDNLDLMHFTYFSYPVMYKKPFIATVHDLTPLFFKTGRASTKNPLLYQIKYHAFTYILAKQISSARAIITPTHAVKNQITSYYGKHVAHKIYPIYEGVDIELIKTKAETDMPNYSFPFLLYIGNFYPHKNIYALIDAYKQVQTDTKLLLVGPDDYFAKRIKAYANENQLGAKVIFAKALSKSELMFFYKHAKGLIHPSLSEGFGLTLVEAAFYNTPIAASDIAPIRELFADSIHYFNPKDTSSIVGTIQILLSTNETPDYRSVLQNLSFEKMAEKTVELYLGMLKKNHE